MAEEEPVLDSVPAAVAPAVYLEEAVRELVALALAVAEEAQARPLKLGAYGKAAAVRVPEAVLELVVPQARVAQAVGQARAELEDLEDLEVDLVAAVQVEVEGEGLAHYLAVRVVEARALAEQVRGLAGLVEAEKLRGSG